MTISVWRYSHLALAVSSFLLLVLASVTGIILSFQPISEKLQPFRSSEFDKLSLAHIIPLLKSQYDEITQLTVDANGFVLLKANDADGENFTAYIDPQNGKILGHPRPKSEFFEWVTALHRSLFLHETGRFFIGLTAFLLLLITISGTALIIQRQRGLKRFFTKIARDHFAQYYHVVLGRLSLIPIFLIALTGTYLSLARFGLIENTYQTADVDFDSLKEEPAKKTAEFDIFRQTRLSDVRAIEFPFSEDVEDYYTLKLKDRELTVNQVTGDILTEVKYPGALLLTELSLELHTGKTSILWAIVLAFSSASILFFIYSGFVIMWKRLAGKTKNRYKAAESEYIILVGSENGSTRTFAGAVYRQLMANGLKAFVTDLNQYDVFPQARHLIVMTATYGLGDAPTNAAQFVTRLKKHHQSQQINFSVVGFGSHSYPDFCQFAFEVDNLLSQQSWAVPFLEIHTVNDKSPVEFGQWVSSWGQHAEIPLAISPGLLAIRKEKRISLTVVDKTRDTLPGESFLIRLQLRKRQKFTSGDLLAIYPANDYRERQYSIGRVDNDIQLSVKLHNPGLGSEYLWKLNKGDQVPACIIDNHHFHLPAKAPVVIMISNGTGIAPFLGMISGKKTRTKRYLYCGFRDYASYSLYEPAINETLHEEKVSAVKIAYSREGERQYVRDLLIKDQEFVVQALAKKGVIMLCGSLAMQKNVVSFLDEICHLHLGQPVSFYQSRGQILMDCY